MPNVFVLCTGRCGSATFAHACDHATNYTTGHETRAHVVGPDRLDYPANHIEVDNRLAWFLGRLDRAYGDSAYYVHLTRDPESVAQSLSIRTGMCSLVNAYARGIAIRGDAGDPLATARDLVSTMTANIETFLRGRSNVMRFPMESADDLFPHFWQWIGAEGDIASARAEWSVAHNHSIGV